MGRAHSRRLNLIALVVLLVALAAGTGLRVHAQRASPNVQHDEAWSYRERRRPSRPVPGRDRRRPHGPLGPDERVAALLAVGRPERCGSHRAGPRGVRRAPATLLRPAARLAARHGRARVGGARAQPGLRGPHRPQHLLVRPRPRLRTHRGRPRRPGLGRQPRRGQHLVHRATIRPRGPDHGAARLGTGARERAERRRRRHGAGARRGAPLAHRRLGGGGRRGGVADALSGGAADRRRRSLRPRRRAPVGPRWAAALVAAAPRSGRRNARRRPARARLVRSVRARALAAGRHLRACLHREARRDRPDARPVRRRPRRRHRRGARRRRRAVPRPGYPPCSHEAHRESSPGWWTILFYHARHRRRHLPAEPPLLEHAAAHQRPATSRWPGRSSPSCRCCSSGSRDGYATRSPRPSACSCWSRRPSRRRCSTAAPTGCR